MCLFIFYLFIYVVGHTVNFVLKQRSFNCLRNYLLLWHRVTVTALLEWAHELVKFSKS